MFEVILWFMYGIAVGCTAEVFSHAWWVALVGPHIVTILLKVRS